MKMTSTVRIKAPLVQVIELDVRYDREWKCHFLSLTNTETRPKGEREITELVTICLNDRKEVDQFINMIKKATRHIK